MIKKATIDNKPLVLHLNTRLKHLNQPMRSPR